jgi:RNA methyltransferase, TrmH family
VTNERLITSGANPLVKRIRFLRQRKHRDEESAFFVEGIRPVWQAVDSGADVETLVVAPDLLKSESARQMVQTWGAQGTEIVSVSAGVFERIAQRDHPSGLGAVVRISPRSLVDLPVRDSSIFAAVSGPGNPGNIGAILRTLDAVGADGLVLIGKGSDPYHPSAVKASMGSLFNLPTVQVPDMEDVLEWSASHRVKVVTTSPHASTPYWSAEYVSPLMFLFGSEGEGLPDETLGRGDLAIRIPMTGGADSLNLAVSVGVVLYELERQRALTPQTVKV